MSEQAPEDAVPPSSGTQGAERNRNAGGTSRVALGIVVSIAVVLAIVLGVVAFARRGDGGLAPLSVAGAPGGSQNRASLLGRPKEEIAKALPHLSDLPAGWTLSTKNPMDEITSLVSELPSAPPQEQPEDSTAFTPAGCDFLAEMKQVGALFGGAVPQSRDGLGKLAAASRNMLGYAQAVPPGEGASALPGLGGRAVQVKLIGGLPPEALEATGRFKAFIERCPAIHGEQSSEGGKMAMDIEWGPFEPPATVGEKAMGLSMTMTMTMEFDGHAGNKIVSATRVMASQVRGVFVEVSASGDNLEQDAQLAERLYKLTTQRLGDLP